MLGLCDMTMARDGKGGILFTDTAVYDVELPDKPQVIRYDDIDSVEVVGQWSSCDCDRTLRFHMKNYSCIDWESTRLNKTPLCAFFTELLRMIPGPEHTICGNAGNRAAEAVSHDKAVCLPDNAADRTNGESVASGKLIYNRAQTFEAAVVSTISSGKSTFINALIGEELLPSRGQACTARVTAVLDNDAAQSTTGHVLFSNGVYKKVEACTADLVADLLENQRDLLADLVVECSIPGIRNIGRALLLVDTPGVNNSVNPSHGEITRAYLSRLTDGIILYILNGTQLGTYDMEEDLLRLHALIKEKPDTEVLFILNKMDEFDIEREPIESAIADCLSFLQAMGFSHISLYPVSALAALLFKRALSGTELSKREGADFSRLFDRFRCPNPSERMPSYIVGSDRPKYGDLCQVKGKEYRRVELLAALENTGLPAVERAIEDRMIRYALRKAPEIQPPGSKQAGLFPGWS